MQARSWLNRHAGLATIIAVVVLIASICFLLYMKSGSGNDAEDVYYFDLGSTASNPLDRLFISRSKMPPIVAPSGASVDGRPAGVRAWVFACGSCAEGTPRFIGYLTTSNPDAGAPPAPGPTANKGPQPTLIRALEQASWAPLSSPESMAIQQAVVARCPDPQAPPVECLPDR
jgi:hypothetical protein